MQSSSKEEEEEKAVTADKLHQKFLNLQQEWDNFKKYSSNSRSKPFRGSLLDHDVSSNLTVQNRTSSTTSTTLNLLHINISPRSLMSSLQTSPSEIMCRNMNDSAVQEILRDRREAIERGSLKGRRRLFEDDDQAQEISEVGSVVSFDDRDHDDSEIGDDDRNDDDPFGSGGNADHIPVRFRGNSCCLSGQKVEREEVVVEKMSVGDDNNIGRTSYKVIMRWLAVVSVILAICIIRIFGEFHDEDEVILVPT